MSGHDRLFAIAPLGGTHLLIAAERLQEIAPVSQAEASEWPCFDLAVELALEATGERHALLVDAAAGGAWLLVERGMRFDRLAPETLRPLPGWLFPADSPLSSLAVISDRGGFGFELDLDRLVRGHCPEPEPEPERETESAG